METQLYPLKFHPIYKYRIWGGDKLKNKLNKHDAPEKCGESWEISAVPENISIVSNGFLAENNLEEIIETYMGEIVGDSVYEQFGVQFPLLIKFVEAAEDLSVQVHPNDKLAAKKHNQNGKTEMWYILESDDNAQNITGLNKKTTASEIKQLLSQNKIEEVLFSETSNAGDLIFIPAGRVHAAGKGNLFVEIQQTSDLTYRLYDYNRKDDKGKPRQLHIDDALEAIDFNQTGSAKILYKTEKNSSTNIIYNQYFILNQIDFNKKITNNYVSLDSFVIYICIEGKCTFRCDENTDVETLQYGEVCLIPAIFNRVEMIPKTEKTVILEVYIDIIK